MALSVIDILAVIAAGACVWWGAIYLLRLLGWIERSEIARQEAAAAAERKRAAARAAPAAQQESAGIPADHVVAIAAAVAAYGFKVVHIADAATGHAWASEGRWMHQTSHQTSHRPY
jgi:hypothetical protein